MMTRPHQTSKPNNRLNKSNQAVFRRAELTSKSVFGSLGGVGGRAVMGRGLRL